MLGTLILVVGPSGVGKDTLLDGARAEFKNDLRFHFLRRDITRPADAGGEDHRPVTIEQFQANEKANRYALTWGAHDLRYGLPKSELASLVEGRSVVANGSRSVLGQARNQFERIAIVSITASEALLRERLQMRGRETLDDIERRIARATAFDVVGEDVSVFSNDSTIQDGIAEFVRLLDRLHNGLIG